MVARLFRSFRRTAGPITAAGLLQILSNLANDTRRCQRSDKRIVPGRCGDAKGVNTRQEMKRALIITVVLICISDRRWWRSRAIR